MEHFDASMSSAEALRRDGDVDGAIEEYLLLFEDAGHIHPGAQVLVASRLSALYDYQGEPERSMQWSERAVTVHASDADQATGTGMIGRRHAAKLRDKGRYIEAAEAYEASVNSNESARFQHDSWASAANMYISAGEIQRARMAIAMGEPLVHVMDVSDQHYLMARSLLVGLNNQFLVDDPSYIFDLSLDIFYDPRLADTPERLEVIGWKGIEYGTMSARSEEAELLARDVLAEAARFESELEPDDPRRLGISNAYIHSARNLYNILSRKGESMEALEVLETAFRTYPDSIYRNMLLSVLHLEYDAQGLDSSGLPRLNPEESQSIRMLQDGTTYRPGVDVVEASLKAPVSPDPTRPLSTQGKRIPGGLAYGAVHPVGANADDEGGTPRWIWPAVAALGLTLLGMWRLKK